MTITPEERAYFRQCGVLFRKGIDGLLDALEAAERELSTSRADVALLDQGMAMLQRDLEAVTRERDFWKQEAADVRENFERIIKCKRDRNAMATGEGE